MQQHNGNTLTELIEMNDRLGELLRERERLLEESLPPQLRKQPEPEKITGPCEASRSYGYDPTGENAVPCGSDGEYYADVELILCRHCRKAVC
jgi:hypothetical protein